MMKKIDLRGVDDFHPLSKFVEIYPHRIGRLFPCINNMEGEIYNEQWIFDFDARRVDYTKDRVIIHRWDRDIIRISLTRYGECRMISINKRTWTVSFDRQPIRYR